MDDPLENGLTPSGRCLVQKQIALHQLTRWVSNIRDGFDFAHLAHEINSREATKLRQSVALLPGIDSLICSLP
jgi:hypothetical protein